MVQLKRENLIRSLLNDEMIANIYGYCYKRCFQKNEAEDLCQDIITEILIAIKNNQINSQNIGNANAYIWKIAHNTYVNHINAQKRIQRSSCDINEAENPNVCSAVCAYMENDVVERIVDSENLSRIKREIAFLSKIYREVMIMFYFDELPIAEIAKRLNIPENRVKQRLFSAKEQIRKEVIKMNKTNTDKILKPLRLSMPGTGNPLKSDPRNSVGTLLRQNIIVSCREKAKTAKELSDEFCIPTIFMEDELNRISEDMLKKVGEDKYIANSIVMDIALQEKIDGMISNIAAEYAKELKEYLYSNKDYIMSLDYVAAPKNFEYLLWWYMPQYEHVVTSALYTKISELLEKDGIEREYRQFYVLCQVEEPDKDFDGKTSNQNGISVKNIFGYDEVSVINVSINPYLSWDKGRFGCAPDFSDYASETSMIFKTIGGLDESAVEEKDKELAAKALEKGYIKKENGTLYPDVIIMPQSTYDKLHYMQWSNKIAEKYADKMVGEYVRIIKSNIPPHLMGQAGVFASLTASSLGYFLVGEFVKDKTLYIPPETKCTEGIFAIVKSAGE